MILDALAVPVASRYVASPILYRMSEFRPRSFTDPNIYSIQLSEDWRLGPIVLERRDHDLKLDK